MVLIKYSKNISWTLLGSEVFVFDERKDNIKILKNEQCKLWIQIEEFLKKNFLWNFDLMEEKNKILFDKWFRQGLIVMEDEHETRIII